MSITNVERAVLASSVYLRDALNKVGVPSGFASIASARLLASEPPIAIDGFYGEAYYNESSGQLVISFEGTSSFGIGEILHDPDWFGANVPLATGGRSAGFLRALEFVADALRQASARPNFSWDRVEFTGHSLGGGYAGLMAVFFDRPATVFATAPFANSAFGGSLEQASWISRQRVKEYYSHFANIAGRTGSVPAQAIDAFRAYSDATASTLQWEYEFDARREEVHQIYVEGEINTELRERIPTIAANGPGELIELPESSTSAFALHSIDLHALLLRANGLRTAIFAQPELVQLLVTEKLYGSNTDSSGVATASILSSLLRGDVGGPDQAPYDGSRKFASDANEIGTVHGSLLRLGLLSSLIESYTFAREFGEEGWIHTNDSALWLRLDGSASNPPLQGRGRAALMDIVRGILGTEMPADRAAALDQIQTFTTSRLDAAIIASDVFTLDDHDLMLGSTGTDQLVSGGGDDILASGGGSDTLVGGSGDDFLFGGADADTLTGGADDDYLLGGAGADTYEFGNSSGRDTVVDSDGIGVIKLAGTVLTVGSAFAENYWKLTNPGFNLIRTGSGAGGVYTLVVFNDSLGSRIEIRDWSEGKLGISLTGVPSGRAGTAGNDNMVANEGETVLGQGANDFISSYHPSLGILPSVSLGGAGDDLLTGSTDANVLSGGSGRDFLFGHVQITQLSPAAPDALPAISPTRYAVIAGRSWAVTLPVEQASGTEFRDLNFGIAGASYGDYWYPHAGGSYDQADVLDGGAGDDFVLAGAGDDVLLGGDNDDVLIGMSGADTIEGGEGMDRIAGDNHAWVIDDPNVRYMTYDPIAADDDDVISGGGGRDFIIGNGGSDSIRGDDEDDVIYGDDDRVGSLTPPAGLRPGTPLQWHGNDHVDGGAGDDYIVGGGGADMLYGGADNDHLIGDGSVVTDEYAGDDQLDGGAGDDTLEGGFGNDTLIGGAGLDVLRGGLGDDVYIVRSRDDVPIRGLEAEGIVDLDGNNTLYFQSDFTSTSVELRDAGGGDVLVGLRGTDSSGNSTDLEWGIVLSGVQRGGSLRVVMSDGVELDVEQVLGTRLNSVIATSSTGNGAIARGGRLSDRLALTGNDAVMTGGRGDDQLTGGPGSTTYRFAIGDGVDRVNDPSTAVSSGGTKINVLRISSPLPLAAIGIEAFAGGSEMRITVGQNGDAVRLQTFSMTDVAGPTRTIDEVVVEGQAPVSWSSLVATQGVRITNPLALAQYSGTNVSDSIAGAPNSEVISAGAGDDRIDGGGGDDVLSGGSGSDTYVFGAGSGRDTINNGDTALGKVDRLEISSLLLRSEVDFVRSGTNLLVRVSGTADELVVTDFFGSAGLDEIIFADGTRYTPASVPAITSGGATSGNDSLFGTTGPDLIDGLAGNDVIRGSDGDDVLLGATGNDSLLGEAGDDRLEGGPGVDTLEGGDGHDYLAGGPIENDTLRGGGGDDVLVGNGLLEGGAGNDRLEGGSNGLSTLRGGDGDDVLTGGAGGSDTLDGGSGNDTYVYNSGDGIDTIQQNDPGVGRVDTLRLGPGIRPTDVVVRGDGNDLLVSFRLPNGELASEWLTLSGFVSDTTGAQRIDRLTFASYPDTVWTSADILAAAARGVSTPNFSYAGVYVGQAGADDAVGPDTGFIAYGRDGADRLEAIAGPSRLFGEAGNDTLVGGSGSNLLDGGAGDDVLVARGTDSRLVGGTGADVYSVGLAARQVEIDHADFTSSVDALRFESGINPTQVRGRRQGGDLELEVLRATDGGVATTVSVRQFFSSRWVLDEIRFADSPTTVWNRQQIEALTLEARDAAEIQIGSAGNDIIQGGGGNDELGAGDGDDELAGGSGNDQLYGGDGNDVYRFGRGLGYDEVQDVGSSGDAVVLEAGVTPTDVQLVRTSGAGVLGQYLPISPSGDDLLIVIDGGSSQLRIENFFDPSGSRQVEEIRFAGGTIWNLADILARVSNQSGSTNTSTGTAANDLFTVDHRNDVVVETSGGGVDSIASSVTFTLPAHVENLTLTGTLANGAFGNSLANRLEGNGAANWLDGGAGADVLIGGAGDDTYVVGDSVTSDSVIEVAGNGTDTVLLKAPTSYALPAEVENLTAEWSGTYDPVELSGNALSNRLDASGVRDTGVTLDGGLGADVLIGGHGSTVFVVDHEGDTVVEYHDRASGDADEVRSSVSYALPVHVERLVLTGASPIQGTGNGDANVLAAWENPASNLLSGGAGDDTYYIGSNDSVAEANGNGRDRVVLRSGAAGTFSAANWGEVEEIQLTAALGASELVGDARDNVLIGNLFGNTLRGEAGDDLLVDKSDVGGDSDRDYLFGGDGDDRLESTVGADEQDGGRGDDLLVSRNYDVRTFWFGRQYDHDVISNEGYGAGIIRLRPGVAPGDVNAIRSGNDIVLGIAGTSDQLVVLDQALYGNKVSEVRFDDGTVWTAAQIATAATVGLFDGNSSPNRLRGASGDDTLRGFDGADDLSGHGGDDRLFGGAGEDRLGGGSGDDELTGGAGADTYVFSLNVDGVPGRGFGRDVIQDTDAGGLGDSAIDVIRFDHTVRRADVRFQVSPASASDLLIRVVGRADQIVVRSFFAAGSRNDAIERIEFADGTVLGPADVLGMPVIAGSTGDDVLVAETVGTWLMGQAGNDTLTGSAGADVLDGGSGLDLMAGLGGNDRYMVDSPGDTVLEAVGAGRDAVEARLSYVLPAHVEDLLLTGSEGNSGTGNDLANWIVGNSADNVLDGATGADVMEGREGNDTYVVDDTGDTVTELPNHGIDTVRSTVSHTLGSHVENLVLVAGALAGTGNGLDNRIEGNALDNVLDGSAGADTLLGSDGDDTYIVDSILDVVTEFAGHGTDEVRSSVSMSLPANVERLTLLGSSSLNATGGTGADLLVGNAGANVLDGGAGADTLRGGPGNDTYVVDDAGDLVEEAASEGTDAVQSSVSHVLSANVENLTLIGSAAISATGNGLANTLVGNAGANRLDGGGGADTLQGGAGDDTYVVDHAGDTITEGSGAGNDTVESGITYTLGSNLERLMLTGADATNATGNTLANVLVGNAGDNRLNGLAGADQMSGGSGNDTYVVDDVADTVIEAAGGGTDTVESTITYILGSHLENLTLTGASAINGTGNALANVLTGNSGANRLDGNAGADTMAGGSGNDTYVVDNVGDLVSDTGGTDTVESSVTFTLPSTVENLMLTGSTAISGTGNASANVLTGNAAANTLTGGGGNDTLNGGVGADTLIGGAGNDRYVIDDVGDGVTELASEGTDLVESSVTYTLGANVENLTLTGTSAINGTGNALANALVGNSASNTLSAGAGNDTLDGGAGADTLIGGSGNDTYIVDHVGDVVTELAAEGADLVQSSVTVALAAHVENLTLTGSSAINGTGNTLDNVLTGNSGANTLTGAAGNDTLDGGSGADTMVGGAGNDTYAVDNVGDVIIELTGEGTDQVSASVTYTLSANIENLTLTGSSAINGTGNTLDNLLTGNSGANVLTGGAGDDTLNGGSGADSLIGGSGNDTYTVDNGGDVVTELVGEGVDAVNSSVTHTLAANVENLTLTGSSAISGTGNALDNVLTGNSGVNTLTAGAGNDTLNGGSGADTMVGGAGNDTYTVDNIGDVITELAEEGVDSVNSSVTHTLASNVDNLTLTGSSAINGTGNALANQLIGNTGANRLSGGAGNDFLRGGNGADVYLYNAGDGQDTIDNVSTDTAIDRLTFNGIARTALGFARSGSDLVITVGGVLSDTVRVSNWFAATGNRVDQIETSGGVITTADQVDALLGGGGGSFANSAPLMMSAGGTLVSPMGLSAGLLAWSPGAATPDSGADVEGFSVASSSPVEGDDAVFGAPPTASLAGADPLVALRAAVEAFGAAGDGRTRHHMLRPGAGRSRELSAAVGEPVSSDTLQETILDRSFTRLIHAMAGFTNDGVAEVKSLRMPVEEWSGRAGRLGVYDRPWASLR